ncbi:MAG: hypothetical protein EHM41_02135 [Chloroflexi bacterium]|nr:MAG: hypothetical protein EHM41_02135 [Chloroflexota bacterium]
MEQRTVEAENPVQMHAWNGPWSRRVKGKACQGSSLPSSLRRNCHRYLGTGYAGTLIRVKLAHKSRRITGGLLF